MNKLIPLAALMLMTTIGCANKQKNDATASPELNGSVTDVDVAPMPVGEPEMTYAAPFVTPGPQQPQPAATAPAAYEAPFVTQTPAAAGGSYTVKKGDTLFGIARQHYGSGSQWQRIASANPGLTPATLKAGTTIAIP